MTNKSAAEIVAIIVTELTPLSSEDRHRVVQASMTLLGESAAKVGSSSPNTGESDAGDVGALSNRARTWIRQNDLSMEQLEQVFHFDDGTVEIIAAEILGNNNKERVRNAYILTGIRSLLLTGDAKFDDQAARTLCDLHGFYDHTNHSKYVKGWNEFAGSRDKGWTLTAPGLKAAASLIKEMTK